LKQFHNLTYKDPDQRQEGVQDAVHSQVDPFWNGMSNAMERQQAATTGVALTAVSNQTIRDGHDFGVVHEWCPARAPIELITVR
jgi:hypothetical protein